MYLLLLIYDKTKELKDFPLPSNEVQIQHLNGVLGSEIKFLQAGMVPIASDIRNFCISPQFLMVAEKLCKPETAIYY